MKFKMVQRNHGYNKMVQKWTQHIMKQDLLLLKNLLRGWRIIFTNAWL